MYSTCMPCKKGSSFAAYPVHAYNSETDQHTWNGGLVTVHLTMPAEGVTALTQISAAFAWVGKQLVRNVQVNVAFDTGSDCRTGLAAS